MEQKVDKEIKDKIFEAVIEIDNWGEKLVTAGICNLFAKYTESKDKEIEYWKQRCEAAEKLVQSPRIWQSDFHKQYFEEWQQLKNKQS